MLTKNRQKTRDQVIPNPTGKGGFADNPQNRNRGTWNSDESISFQYNKLIRLNSDGFAKWLEDNTADKRTVAQEIAYNAVLKAKKDLNYLKEITNRTEGMPTQKTELSGVDGSALTIQIVEDDKIVE